MQCGFESHNMEKIRDMMDVIPKSFFTNEIYGKSWGIDSDTEYLYIKFNTSYIDKASDYIKIFFEGDGIIRIWAYNYCTDHVYKSMTIDTHSYRFQNGSMIERFGKIMRENFNISWWRT